MSYKSKLCDLPTSRFYDKQMDLEIVREARRRAVLGRDVASGARVLEVGCGTRLDQPFLMDALGEAGRIVAIYALVAMLKQAKVRSEEQGYADRANFVRGDARDRDALLRDAGEGGALFSSPRAQRTRSKAALSLRWAALRMR